MSEMVSACCKAKGVVSNLVYGHSNLVCPSCKKLCNFVLEPADPEKFIQPTTALVDTPQPDPFLTWLDEQIEWSVAAHYKGEDTYRAVRNVYKELKGK